MENDRKDHLYIDNILDTPNDTKYPEMLFLNAMQVSAAWDIHKGINGTEEVILAIVDTGVNWKHTDIKDNIKIII